MCKYRQTCIPSNFAWCTTNVDFCLHDKIEALTAHFSRKQGSNMRAVLTAFL